jgi:hypothetical protein
LEKAKPDKGYGALSGEIRLRPVAWDRPTEVRVEAGRQLAAFLGGFFAGATLSDGGSNDYGNGERFTKEESDSAGVSRRLRTAGPRSVSRSRLGAGQALLDPDA